MAVCYGLNLTDVTMFVNFSKSNSHLSQHTSGKVMDHSIVTAFTTEYEIIKMTILHTAVAAGNTSRDCQVVIKCHISWETKNKFHFFLKFQCINC